MKTKRLARVLLAFAGLGGAATLVTAAPGELDPTFGENGLARIGRLGDSDRAAGVFVQSDGKLLVGRSVDLAQADFSVVRLDPAGTRDVTFGFDGITSIDVPNMHGRTLTVIQQVDGNIVVAGRATTDGGVTYNLALARYLADGRTDTGFGTYGVSRADVPTETGAVVQQSDGNLVAAGGHPSACYAWGKVVGANKTTASADSQTVLVRFDAAGTLDASFGGRLQIAWCESGARALAARQPDGKLVAGGFVGPDIAVLRLTADGALDVTFDGDGIAIVPTLALDATSRADAVAVRSDSTIVIAGTAASPCATTDTACDYRAETVVMALNPDGTLDENFGTSGRATVNVRGWERVEASLGGLVVEPNGAIVVGGNAGPQASEPDAPPTYGFVARFTPSGVLDTSFGDRGVTLLDVGQDSAPFAEMNGIARFNDGSIAVAMSAHGGSAPLVVARLAASGGSPGMIGLANTEAEVREGTDATFIVRRTGGSTGWVSVGYEAYLCGDGVSCAHAASGADFGPTEGTLTWDDGDTGDRTIAIPILADDLLEDTETLSLSLSNASGASLAASYGWAEIIDVNAGHGVLQFNAGSVFATETDRRVIVWVTRTGGSAGALTVDYSTTGMTATAGADFGAVRGTLHWEDGDGNAKAIVVPIIPDANAEGDETFQVTLRKPSGGATLAAATTVVTIRGTEAATGGSGGGAVGIVDALLLVPLLLFSAAIRWRRRPRNDREHAALGAKATSTAQVFLCLLGALSLSSCHSDFSSTPAPAVVAAAPPPFSPPFPPATLSEEAWHGYFAGRILIDVDTHYAEALITVDGAIRLFIANPQDIWSSAGSAQFVGTFQRNGDQGSGSGVVIAQGCATSPTGRFCSSSVGAEINIAIATRSRLVGQLQVGPPEGEEPWIFEMNWPTNTYLEPATLQFAAGQYREALAELADDSDVIISVDDAGRIFFQGPLSGCVGNGTLAPHLGAESNVYDVALSLANCAATYAYLNGDFEGLATRTVGSPWDDWGDWLIIWMSARDGAPSRTAVTMWGSRIN
jgi:uncharacterized delta-60 repeat protein